MYEMTLCVVAVVKFEFNCLNIMPVLYSQVANKLASLKLGVIPNVEC